MRAFRGFVCFSSPYSPRPFLMPSSARCPGRTLFSAMDADHSEPGTAEPEPAPSPTLRTLLAGDTCGLVARHLGLAELAALTIVLLPARPRELFEAIEAFAARCLPDAPLWCAAESFSTAAIWSVSVAACDWHPRLFFGGLRAPAYCRVAGSGRCAHGLCQKQELPKQG